MKIYAVVEESVWFAGRYPKLEAEILLGISKPSDRIVIYLCNKERSDFLSRYCILSWVLRGHCKQGIFCNPGF